MAYFSRNTLYNHGCDISHWSYPVNWTTMYNAGATACWLKVGQRTSSDWYTDSELSTTNTAACRAAGLRVGFFWFKNPDVSSNYNSVANAQAEAQYFYDLIVSIGTGSASDMGDIMPFLDYEDNTGEITSVTNDQAYDWIKAFSDKFRELSGHQVLLYTAHYTIVDLAAEGSQLIRSTGETVASLMPLMLSATNVTTDDDVDMTKFGGYGVFRVWQYSTDNPPNYRGSEFGVSEDSIDLDYIDAWDRVSRPPSVTGLTATGSNNTATITFNASLYDDVATLNLLTDNQTRLIASTTGWNAHNSATISKDANYTLNGNNSLKIITPGSVNYEGAKTGLITVTAATQYTASAYVKGTVGGTVRLVLADFTSGGSYLGETEATITLTDSWQRLSVTRTTGATGVKVIVYLLTTGTSAYTFYSNSAQLEAGATATKPCCGKRYGSQVLNYTIYEGETLKAAITATQAASYTTDLTDQRYESHTYTVYVNTLFDRSAVQSATVTLSNPGVTYFTRDHLYNSGCDVDASQYPVTWSTMYSAGSTACYLKAGEKLLSGWDTDDQLSISNTTACRSAGLRAGFYWYKNPDISTTHNSTDNAETEAEYFYDLIVSTGTGSTSDMGDLMPLLNYEDPTGAITSVTNDQAYDWIKAFSDKFKALSGQQVMLYTAYNTIDGFTSDGIQLIRSTGETMASVMPLCLSAVDEGNDVDADLIKFGGYSSFRMWQYSGDNPPNAYGSTYGVSQAYIDLDYMDAWDRISRPPVVTNLAASGNDSTTTITFDASLYDDVVTLNLMTDNQTRLIAGTTGWTAHNSTTISKETGYTLNGNNSLKIVTPGSVNYEGARTGLITVTAGTQYTASVYVKGTVGGIVRIVLADFTSGGSYIGETETYITLTDNWQRLSVTHTTTATTGVRVIVYLQTTGTAAYTFYTNSAQLEAGSVATKPFCGKRYGSQVLNYTIYEGATLKGTVTATQAANYTKDLTSQSYGSHTYTVYANTLLDRSIAQTVAITLSEPIPETTYYESTLTGVTISAAVDYLIDYALGTDYSREISEIPVVLPVIEFGEDNDVWSTIEKLAEAAAAKAYFYNNKFYFVSPLSSSWTEPSSSSYTFAGTNILDYQESVSENDLINIVKVNSNIKTLQKRQRVVTPPSNTTASIVDTYKYNDGKSALGVDNKTITLKWQDPSSLNWVNSYNVPVYDYNGVTDVKVYDMANGGVELAVSGLHPGTYDVPATVTLTNVLNPASYHINIEYKYYIDRVTNGKYKEYTFDIDKPVFAIETPIITGVVGTKEFTAVTTAPNPVEDHVLLYDVTLTNNNQRLKFKVENNVEPIDYGNSNYLHGTGSFSFDTQEWSDNDYFSTTRTEKYSGSYSMVFNADTATTTSIDSGLRLWNEKRAGYFTEEVVSQIWVKSNLSAGSIVVKVERYDKNRNLVDTQSNFAIANNNTWTRYVNYPKIRFADENYVKVIITVTNGVGTAYFDDVYVERLDRKKKNSIPNGGFEAYTIYPNSDTNSNVTGWNYSTNMVVADGEEYVTGFSALKFYSTSSKTESTTNGYITGYPTTSYDFGGYIYKNLSSGSAKIELEEYNVSKTLIATTTLTATLSEEWEKLTGSVTTQATTKYIKTKLTVTSAIGTVYFDEIFLRETDSVMDYFVINNIEVWGRPAECVEAITVKSVGDTSEYKNVYEINNDYFSNSDFCRYVADYYRHFYEQDRSTLEINVRGMPLIELLDRVTVTDTAINTSLDYKVVGIKESLSRNGEYVTSLTLLSLTAAWTYDSTKMISNFSFSLANKQTLDPMAIERHDDFRLIYVNKAPTFSTTIYFQPVKTVYSFVEIMDVTVSYQVYDGALWGTKIYHGSLISTDDTSYELSGLTGDSTSYRIFIDVFDTVGNNTNNNNTYYELITPTQAPPDKLTGLTIASSPKGIVIS